MKTTDSLDTRRCPVCLKNLSDSARANQLYCSTTCAERGRKRRQRNKPIADPVISAHDASQLEEELRLKDRRIARLEALVKQQRYLNAKNRSRALDAQSAIATARDKQRETETEITQSLEERIASYLERIATLEIEAEALRKRNAQSQQHIQELQAAHQFAIDQSQHFKKEMKNAASAIAKLKASLSAPSAIFVDYRYFARWYFQKKPKREWDDHDYNRLNRLNSYIKSASTAHQAKTGQGQARKPKTRVRMNRFQ